MTEQRTWKQSPSAWGSPGSARPVGWKRIRGRVLHRDGHRCTWIGNYPPSSIDSPHGGWPFDEQGPIEVNTPYQKDHPARCTERATQVDHAGPAHDHRLDHLRSLCEWHHAKRTGRQGWQAMRAKKPNAAEPRHPGLLP